MRCSRDRLPDTRETVRDHSRTVFRATKAGALYAIIVFVIGFILGTIRVLLVATRLGETTAVIIEAPIMLAASWFVCRSCVNWLDVGRTVPARSGMGSVAFLVLMSAEGRTRCCTRSIFGRSACRLQIAPRRDRSWRSDDLCRIPGHSGLAPVRQTFRPAKCRRSLDRQFSVSQTGNELPRNKVVGLGGCWSPGSSPGMIAREH